MSNKRAVCDRPVLTLFLLCQRPETPMSFAPHGWKTLLDLRYLQVKFDTRYVTLAELRGHLPTELGVEKVTIPVSRPTTSRSTDMTNTRLFV
jgi:hypothetical protein